MSSGSVNGRSTWTSCQDRQYNQSMKTTFQFVNLGFAFLVFILMIVVCFAFSYNVKMIQDVPFIVQQISFLAGGVQDQACYYMGLRGMCFAVCGSVTPFYPADSTYRNCQQANSISYAQQVDNCKNAPVEQQSSVYCTAANSCSTGGIVCFAFALLAILCAACTLYYSHLRMNGDSQKHKAYSVIWSLSTFVCCLACYISMQACAKNAMDATTAYFDPDNQYTNLMVTASPGIAGIATIVGFTIFTYVFVLNLHMPALTTDDELTDPLFSEK